MELNFGIKCEPKQGEPLVCQAKYNEYEGKIRITQKNNRLNLDVQGNKELVKQVKKFEQEIIDKVKHLFKK